MLDRIVRVQIIFYFVGVAIAWGIFARAVTGISIKRLIKASGNMSKSNHALMKLVRAKFEHACMASDKVYNIDAFVDKYLFEYRTMGIRLHTWMQCEKAAIWMCAILCLLGGLTGYFGQNTQGQAGSYLTVGIAGTGILILLHLAADEKYRLGAVRNYMIDFLENTYAHRFEKNEKKEIQEVEEQEIREETDSFYRKEPQVQPVSSTRIREVIPAPDNSSVEKEEPKDTLDPAKEEKIRQILEAFLT